MFQGLVSFPSLQNIIQGSFSLSHGIAPSIALIQIVPVQAITAIDGTLSFTYGPVQIDFPDCRIDSGSLQRNQGGQVVSLRIMDRRWRWRYGEIIGSYNERDSEDELITDTEKTPRELATLLLNAMGEGGFDVTALPNDTRPTVIWDYANPASELESLCSSLGCRVVLGIDNVVSIRRKGVGGLLPTQDLMTVNFGLDPPDGPSNVKVIGAPTIVQDRFDLVAVGEDTDGEIKRADELSYRPEGGWENESPYYFHEVLNQFGEKEHKLAMKSVFRWYQLAAPAHGSGTLPDNALPLRAELAEARESENLNEKKAKKPFVVGQYWQGGTQYTNTEPGTEIDVDFDLDTEEGIVKFSDPVAQLVNEDDHRYLFPDFQLQVEVAFHTRNPDTRLPERSGYDLSVNLGANTGPQIEFANDVAFKKIYQFDDNGTPTGDVDTNENEVSEELQRRAQAFAEQYAPVNSFEAKYAGLVAINPDGAIQQVSWSVSQAGAITQASINDEFDLAIPPYEKRVEDRRAKEAAKKTQSKEIHREQEIWNQKKK